MTTTILVITLGIEGLILSVLLTCHRLMLYSKSKEIVNSLGLRLGKHFMFLGVEFYLSLCHSCFIYEAVHNLLLYLIDVG